MRSWTVQSGVLMMNCRLKYQKHGNGYALAPFFSTIQVKHWMHQTGLGKNWLISLHQTYIGIGLCWTHLRKCFSRIQRLKNVQCSKGIYLFVKAVTSVVLLSGITICLCGYRTTFTVLEHMYQFALAFSIISSIYTKEQDGSVEKALRYKVYPPMPYIIYFFHYRRLKNNSE